MSSFIQRSQSKNAPSVSLEQLLAAKTKEINLKDSIHSAEPSSFINSRVETSLLAKHAQSQAKITAMRLKKQAKEAKEMQPIPKISKVSKQIVEIREGKSDNTVSGYANQIVSSTRSSVGVFMHPRHTFLSLEDLQNQEIEERETRNQFFHRKCDSEGQKFSESCFSFIRLKESAKKKVETRESTREIAHLSMADLRNAVFQRKNLIETEKQRHDLLNMSVLQRNNFWLSEKNKKLLKEKELKALQETQACTFSPRLAPKVFVGKDPRRSQNSGNSYSLKYSQRLDSTKSAKKDSKTPISSYNSSQKGSMLYKALSPHKLKVSQSQSTAFFEKAVPMVHYNT